MKDALTGLAAALLTVAAQAQQATPICKVPPPKVAGVVWQGQAAYMAKAYVADGRVRNVEITSLTSRVDRRTQRMLTMAIDTALRGATCEPGNHVFEQRFDFDLPAAPATPAASHAG